MERQRDEAFWKEVRKTMTNYFYEHTARRTRPRPGRDEVEEMKIQDVQARVKKELLRIPPDEDLSVLLGKEK